VRLVHTLPAGSHFRRAVADDDELHRLLDEQDGTPTARRPSVRDWTDHDELLAVLTDVGNLIQHAIAASVTPKGKAPPKFVPVRRPETAADRARRRRELQTHRDIVAMVLPSGR
jgi:hypothetical protein